MGGARAKPKPDPVKVRRSSGSRSFEAPARSTARHCLNSGDIGGVNILRHTTVPTKPADDCKANILPIKIASENLSNIERIQQVTYGRVEVDYAISIPLFKYPAHRNSTSLHHAFEGATKGSFRRGPSFATNLPHTPQVIASDTEKYAVDV